MPSLLASERDLLARLRHGHGLVDLIPDLVRHRLLTCLSSLPDELRPSDHAVHALDQVAGPIRERARSFPAHEQALVEAFHRHAARTLIAKGALVAHTLYPDPSDRVRTDIDIVVHPAEVGLAREVLAGIGYRPARSVHGGAPTHQEPWVLIDQPRLCVDLHWRLNDHPALSYAFDFDELWNERVVVGRLSPHAFGLSPVHALIHACMHYFGHNRGEFRPLVWLLDIGLLWGSVAPDERTRVAETSRRHGVSVLVCSGLELARQAFSVPVDVECLRRQLAPARDERSAWLIAPFRSRLLDLWFALRSEPGWRRRAAHLRAVLLPPARYLEAKYPDGSWLGYPGLVLRRLRGARRDLSGKEEK